MKRLSNCHRKTPVHKEDKYPDFYELAKTNPLPDVPLTRGGQVGGVGASMAMMNPTLAALGGGAGFSQGLQGLFGQNPLGGAASGNNLMSQLLANPTSGFQAQAGPDVSRLTQLQRDNEELRRRIFDLEKAKGTAGAQAPGNQVPDQHPLVALSSPHAVPTNPGAIGNDMINRELERMQSMYANGVKMNNPLLTSLGGGAGAPPVPGAMPGMGGTNAREFSFMPSFPRGEMLLNSMRGDNQMGYRPQGSQGPDSNSSTTSSLERALQQHSAHATPPVPGGVAMTADDRNKLVMDYIAKQKQQGGAL